jgi:succinate dehydrogenase / fumarate reductase cytochrome b subunit
MLAKFAKLRFNTVVGKKIVMAITGLAMCLFLVGHLAGNLLLVWKKDAFNAYAEFLTPLPLVPIMELGLLLILLFHVFDAFALLRVNSNARPVPYHTKKWGRSKSPKSKKTVASTFMMWSGIVILVFIVFHVWHFKYHHPVFSEKVGGGHNPNLVLGGLSGGNPGVAQPGVGENSGQEAFKLATLVINELSNPIMGGIYVLCMVILGLHLYHAVSSAFTSLGANHPRYQKGLIWFGNIFTLVICGGFTIIPVLILLKVVK